MVDRIIEHVLKSSFGEYLSGLDLNVGFLNGNISLSNVQIKEKLIE